MPKISILTASVRPEGLDVVRKCLDRQDFKDFEWIIVGDQAVCEKMGHQYSFHQTTRVVQGSPYEIHVVKERPKRPGDFYNLTKSYNDLFKHASGELAVMWTDLTWAPPTVLTDFWTHYEKNPRALVGGVGDQFEPGIVGMGGEPTVQVWQDPRRRLDQGSFYEINPVDFEMCLASIPVKAVYDVGGFEEDFDKVAALGEKCLCLRIDKLNYKFYLDQSLIYKAFKHPRLHGQEEWDKHYFEGCKYMEKCLHEINEGTRLKLDYLKEK